MIEMKFFCDTCILAKGTYSFEEDHNNAIEFLNRINVETSEYVLSEYKNLNERRRKIHPIILEVINKKNSPPQDEKLGEFIDLVLKRSKNKGVSVGSNDEEHFKKLLTKIIENMNKKQNRSVQNCIVELNSLLSYNRSRCREVPKCFTTKNYKESKELLDILKNVIPYEQDRRVTHDFVLWHHENKQDSKFFVTEDNTHILSKKDEIKKELVKNLGCLEIDVLNFKEAYKNS